MNNRTIPQPMYSAMSQLSIPKRQAGLTLVEMMIAITLGLVVLLAIGSIYSGSRQTYRVQEDNARIQESGRYALEVIGRSIRQAGADAEMSFNPVVITAECGTAAPCNTIFGTNAATDTLAVQFYAGREELNGGVWITRDCTGGAVGAGALPANVVTNTFNVAGGSLQCTGGVGGTQALVSDVEDLQVLYGIDTTGDQAADQYVATPGNWSQVVTARVCVQLRSANNGLVAAAQRYMNCAGAMGTVTGAAAFTNAADRRLHRTFVATYNLRNRINGAP
jgi:type IV pilus assembly protein PilW